MSKCLFLPPLLHPLETLTSYQAPTETEPLPRPRAAQLHCTAVLGEEKSSSVALKDAWSSTWGGVPKPYSHHSPQLSPPAPGASTYTRCCCCRKSLCIWLKRGSQHLACLYLMTSASGFHTAGKEQPQHNRSHLELRLALGLQLYIIQTKWVLLGLLTAAGGVDSTPPPSHTTPDLLHLRPPIFPCAASNAVLLSCDLMCGCPQRTPGK